MTFWATIYFLGGLIAGGPMVGGTYERMGPYHDKALCRWALEYRRAELLRAGDPKATAIVSMTCHQREEKRR